jgi:PadR family transcriptional regulator, regulatory protein PadR
MTKDAGRLFTDDRGLLQGTLELLVLKALSAGPQHGYGIARWIEEATGDALRVEEGSLYPALHRMEEAGWLRASWITKENGRRVRAYRVTAAGKGQLADEESRWRSTTSAVNRVLEEF